jgi:hypothetical protein
MSRFAIALWIGIAAALAGAAVFVVPRGGQAAQWLAAADDPARLSDLALEGSLDGKVVAREIEAALAADDPDLATSFLALAQERGIAVDPALGRRVAMAGMAQASATRRMGDFARGFLTGEPDDMASLAGTAVGDLFVFGDARDAVREAIHYVRGEEVDEMILGLAAVGIGITAGTYATFGLGAPARVGVSVIKAARRTGRIGTRFGGALRHAVAEAVDTGALKQALTPAALVRPASAVRAAREAIKVEKAGGLMHLVRDAGRVQSKAGTRAALDGLKLAEEPKDVARLARLAEAKGGQTRAIIKLLGRGAIALTTAAFDLALWVFWALLNLLGLCAALKRAVERMTLRFIQRRKLRRLAMRERHLAIAAAGL